MYPARIHPLAADLGIFRRQSPRSGKNLARDRVVSFCRDRESDVVGGQLGTDSQHLRFVQRRRSGIESVAILHAACRTLLESHCLHRMLDQTTRAHVVRTGRKIRHAEVAQIVRDGPSGCGNLFSSTGLKVDAQSEDLKALHRFPVLVGNLPSDHSCRVKAQCQTLQLFSGLESDESSGRAHPLAARIPKIRCAKPKPRSCRQEDRETRTCRLVRCARCAQHRQPSLCRDRKGRVRLAPWGRVRRYRSGRRVPKFAPALTWRVGDSLFVWAAVTVAGVSKNTAHRAVGDVECETRRLAIELRVHRTCPGEHHTPVPTWMHRALFTIGTELG